MFLYTYCKWKTKSKCILKKRPTLIRVRQNERTDKTTLLLSSVLLRYFVRVFIELKVLRVKVGHEQLLIGLQVRARPTLQMGSTDTHSKICILYVIEDALKSHHRDSS